MRKSAEEIFEDSKAAIGLYYRSEKDRFKLILVRQLTKLISTGVKFVISLMLASLAMFFLFGAIAIIWGQHLDNYALGSLYTGLCIIGLVLLILMLNKAIIKRPIMRSLIEELLEEEDHEIEED